VGLAEAEGLGAADGLAVADSDALAEAAADALGEADAEAEADALGLGDSVALGAGLGVVVSRPPCPRKIALAKMSTNTRMTAATNTLVHGSSTCWTSSRSGSARAARASGRSGAPGTGVLPARSGDPGRGGRVSSLSVTRRSLLVRPDGAARV
jgi:hypothetical protein